jgi:hypothetical protein
MLTDWFMIVVRHAVHLESWRQIHATETPSLLDNPLRAMRWSLVPGARNVADPLMFRARFW